MPTEMVADILRAPMGIRGYGPVKDQAVIRVQAEVASLLPDA